MTRLWTTAALAVGVVLMLIGPLLVSLALPLDAQWTDDDARAYSQASADLHAAGHAQAHRHEHPGQTNHEHAQLEPPVAETAQAAFDRQKARLDAAERRHGWLQLAARGVGVLLAAAGIGGYLLNRRE